MTRVTSKKYGRVCAKLMCTRMHTNVYRINYAAILYMHTSACIIVHDSLCLYTIYAVYLLRTANINKEIL